MPSESQLLFEQWNSRIGCFVRLVPGTESFCRAVASNVSPETLGVVHHIDHNPRANCVATFSFRRQDGLEYVGLGNVKDIEMVPGPVNARQVALCAGDIITVLSTPEIEKYVSDRRPVQFRVLSFGVGLPAVLRPGSVEVLTRYNHTLDRPDEAVQLQFVCNLLPGDGEAIDVPMDDLRIERYEPKTTRFIASALARGEA